VNKISIQRDRLALVLGTGGGALLTMIWMAWAGRVLGPAKSSDLYGGVFLIFAVYMVGHPLNGVTARFSALWHRQAEGAKSRQLHQGLMRWLVKAAVVFAMLFLLTGDWQRSVLNFDSYWALGWAQVAAWLVLVLSVSRGVLRGVGAFSSFAGTMVLEPALRLGCGVLLLWWLPEVSWAMAAYVFASLVTIVFARRQVDGVIEAADAAEIPREVYRFALPMLLMAMADAAYQNVDVLIAKRALQATQAGQFGAMATLTRALAVLVQPFALLVIPLLAGRQVRQNDRTLWKLTGVFLACATIPMAAFFVFAEPLLTGIFGDGYAGASQWLPWHALGSLACFVSLMLAQAFAAIGRFGFLWGYCGIALVMSVGLLWAGDDPLLLTQVGTWAKLACLVLTLATWLWTGNVHRAEAIEE